MKRIVVAILLVSTFSHIITAQNVSENIVISQLYQFSPLGEIITRNLGLWDKNGNGVIDSGVGEGYEEFIEKYGIGTSLEELEHI